MEQQCQAAAIGSNFEKQKGFYWVKQFESLQKRCKAYFLL